MYFNELRHRLPNYMFIFKISVLILQQLLGPLIMVRNKENFILMVLVFTIFLNSVHDGCFHIKWVGKQEAVAWG